MQAQLLSVASQKAETGRGPWIHPNMVSAALVSHSPLHLTPPLCAWCARHLVCTLSMHAWVTFPPPKKKQNKEDTLKCRRASWRLLVCTRKKQCLTAKARIIKMGQWERNFKDTLDAMWHRQVLDGAAQWGRWSWRRNTSWRTMSSRMEPENSFNLKKHIYTSVTSKQVHNWRSSACLCVCVLSQQTKIQIDRLSLICVQRLQWDKSCVGRGGRGRNK